MNTGHKSARLRARGTEASAQNVAQQPTVADAVASRREPTEMEWRVAEALYRSTARVHYDVEAPRPWDEYIRDNRESAEQFLRHAYAAIRSMREPGHDVTAGVCRPGDDRTAYVEIWEKMIDAASPEAQ